MQELLSYMLRKEEEELFYAQTQPKGGKHPLLMPIFQLCWPEAAHSSIKIQENCIPLWL